MYVNVCVTDSQLLSSLSCVTGLVLTGEGLKFLSFTHRHPIILWDMIVFSLCSAVGQVRHYRALHCRAIDRQGSIGH